MSAADRWDAKYADWQEPGSPSEFVIGHADLLAECSTAVDLAGGTGGTALWLASLGIDTTLVDVSGRALEIARSAAAERGVQLRTVCADLEAEPLPSIADLEAEPLPTAAGLGSERGWHAVVCANFLHRPLLGALCGLLAPGGIAFVQIATVDNLLYNARPGRPFLVKRGELPGLCHGLETVSFEEGWFGQRHEARLVARRPS
ncbi:class I SAM-dependent methyltransferase [Candidatus Poriferisodalis sp.]|uniref:class I SAM-dependent methyltransferase n=1 Tax=Candidatus Poriferisodalis sp. TaxID=3101277 RepID=UPI003AF77C73